MLWSYACRCFNGIRTKMNQKSTQIEKKQNRSGATPVVVSAVLCWNRAKIATLFEALELRLSMFQSLRGLTGNQIQQT